MLQYYFYSLFFCNCTFIFLSFKFNQHWMFLQLKHVNKFLMKQIWRSLIYRRQTGWKKDRNLALKNKYGELQIKKIILPKSNTSPNNNRKSINVLDVIIKALLITLCSLQGKGRFFFPAFISARCNSETWAGSLRAMNNLKRGRSLQEVTTGFKHNSWTSLQVLLFFLFFLGREEEKIELF